MNALLLLLCFVLPQNGEIPPNDGWVTDTAGMLTSSEQASLEQLMESYRSGRGMT